MPVHFVSRFIVFNQLCVQKQNLLVIRGLVALSLNSPSLPLCNSVVWGLLVLVMGTAAMGIYCMGLAWLFLSLQRYVPTASTYVCHHP